MCSRQRVSADIYLYHETYRIIAPTLFTFIHTLPYMTDVQLRSIILPSHPQAQLATGCSGSYPLLAGMELSNSRHGCDTVAAKLGQLVATSRVYIYKAIHVTNTETLYRIGWMSLPLGSEAVGG